MPTRKNQGDSPQVGRDRDDSVKLEVATHPFTFADAKQTDNPLNEKIVETVNAMGAVGEKAEEFYQERLSALRRDAKKAIPVVAAEYRALPEAKYVDRWSLVHLMAELQEPTAASALDDILSTAIPPEKSKDPHSFTTVGEEVIIRTTAIEALARLAGKNKTAQELLLKHVNHQNFSVKRAAVQAFLQVGGKDARTVLSKKLAKKDHYILDIRQVDVRQAPQATGGAFLVNRDTDATPPPELGGVKEKIEE